MADHGASGLFFDPPYPEAADRRKDLYSSDDPDVANWAHKVALEYGQNEAIRVAFCGLAGSHEFPESWEEVAWKSSGGYGGGKGGKGEVNRHRERIWFSPGCLRPSKAKQLSLLDPP